MIIKADYHFHPNLPKDKNKALNKAKKWWKCFQDKGINAVIITEHVYKDPKYSYYTMKEACPDDIICFPGIEYTTKEGIDLIVFSNSETIYDHKQLNTTFAMTLDEVIKLIQNDDKIFSYITHPFTLGATSIVKILGIDVFSKYVNIVNAVEISNGSFNHLIKILELPPFRFLLKNRLEWAMRTQSLPKRYYPDKLSFVAVGSDAHIFQDLGSYIKINAESFDKDIAFKSMTTTSNGKVHLDKQPFSLVSLLKNFPIVLNEFIIKKKIKLCSKLSLKHSG